MSISPIVMTPMPASWIGAISSLNAKYPMRVTISTESAIQSTLVIAMPSYLSDRANTYPAPANRIMVAPNNRGFLWMLYNFAQIIPVTSSRVIAAI